MSNKDRDFYSIKPGFDSKNKELALIRLFYCNFAQRNTQHIIQDFLLTTRTDERTY